MQVGVIDNVAYCSLCCMPYHDTCARELSRRFQKQIEEARNLHNVFDIVMGPPFEMEIENVGGNVERVSDSFCSLCCALTGIRSA